MDRLQRAYRRFSHARTGCFAVRDMFPRAKRINLRCFHRAQRRLSREIIAEQMADSKLPDDSFCDDDYGIYDDIDTFDLQDEIR